MHTLASTGPAVALLGSVLAAQGLTFTSPPGADINEGNNSSSVMFGSNAGHQSRVQQADGNFVGDPNLALVSAILWRRDRGVGSSAVARTVDLEVRMAHADLNAFTNTFATNAIDPPVTVFTNKPVNLPDWSATPVPLPAAFDLVVPLDVPWVYNQQDALLWDAIVTNSTGGGRYPNDWFSTALPEVYGQTVLDTGPGCTTANGTFTARFVNRSTPGTYEIGLDAVGAPSTATIWLLAGAGNPNTTFGGLTCRTLDTSAEFAIPVRTSAMDGSLSRTVITLSWLPMLAGLPLTMQAAAPDAGQPGFPFALSNGVLAFLPRSDTSTGLNTRRTFNQTSATSPTGSNPSTSAVPTQFR